VEGESCAQSTCPSGSSVCFTPAAQCPASGVAPFIPPQPPGHNLKLKAGAVSHPGHGLTGMARVKAMQQELLDNGPFVVCIALTDAFYVATDAAAMADLGLPAPLDGVITPTILAEVEARLHRSLYNSTRAAPQSDTVGSHVVKLVGWGATEGAGTSDTGVFWEMQNSWGVGWNGNGFFRIMAGDDVLSVESLCPTAASPLVPNTAPFRSSDNGERRVMRSGSRPSLAWTALASRATIPGTLQAKRHGIEVHHHPQPGRKTSSRTNQADVKAIVSHYRRVAKVPEDHPVHVTEASSQAGRLKKYTVHVQFATPGSWGRRAGTNTIESHTIVAEVQNHPSRLAAVKSLDGKPVQSTNSPEKPSAEDSSNAWVVPVVACAAMGLVASAVMVMKDKTRVTKEHAGSQEQEVVTSNPLQDSDELPTMGPQQQEYMADMGPDVTMDGAIVNV
jgi:hypothetical protein